jgi:REP element-mobilizing transposase RayT
MPKPRKSQVSLEATPYYHCVSRCVRRAFLCGEDHPSGKSYEHRRGWIEERLKELAEIFAVDIGAYAVMSNHYHVVLHIDAEQGNAWDDEEVIARWKRLYSLPVLVLRYLRGEVMSKPELAVVAECVTLWRQRLQDISWFMRCLNEPIARQANQEDGCTGRFWEGRFKSQALLDEKALAACLAYVDLNPVRAGMAETPEQSEHTSVKARVEALQKADSARQANPAHLLPFVGNPRQPMPRGLPFALKDYLALLDWTGRVIREDKRGAIAEAVPPILERLDIDPKQWCYLTQHFESSFKGLVGTAFKLKQVCENLGYRRTPNLKAASTLLS